MCDMNPIVIITITGKGRLDKVEARDGRLAWTPREVVSVTPGHRYRFRVISNGILNCPIRVAVDRHNLTVIATDGSPVEPKVVDSFNIFAGERSVGSTH